MLLIGKHVTTPGDPLQPAPVEKVYQAILHPSQDVATLQKRLQDIRMLDMNQYRKLKTGLPYIVCANFQPKIRRKENFVFTERFIIDIDHLSGFDLDSAGLKKKLKEDPRVEMMFTSPGGDGLKVLFVLKEKISDSGYYALFYKTFCLQFAARYELSGMVDSKTNDVSRCCFVSHDPDAYYNATAEKIDANIFLPLEEANILDSIKTDIQKEEKEQDQIRKKVIEPFAPSKTKDPLSDEILNVIKARVGVKVKKPVEKQYEQPEELNALMAEVMQQVDAVGAAVIGSEPISYGRKIKIGAGKYWAEVNLFYGQRGVSIVGTSKTGSNKELCTTVVDLLKSHFQNS